MSDMYDWERCDHRGIGQIGCPVCDPDKGRVMIRAQRLDNRDLRAQVERLTAERAMTRQAAAARLLACETAFRLAQRSGRPETYREALARLQDAERHVVGMLKGEMR